VHDRPGKSWRDGVVKMILFRIIAILKLFKMGFITDILSAQHDTNCLSVNTFKAVIY